MHLIFYILWNKIPIMIKILIIQKKINPDTNNTIYM